MTEEISVEAEPPVSEEPKFELWQARQWEGRYTWMVFNYAAKGATWFENELDARAFLKRKREGR